MEPSHSESIRAVFDLVGPLYRQAHRKVERDVSRAGISVGVRAVLMMLHYGGPATVPQMARAQSLSRQFAQRMVQEAVAADLVELVPNPAHRKSALVRLTSVGRATVAEIADRERELFRQAGVGLDGADLDACIRVLTRLRLFLDGAAAD